MVMRAKRISNVRTSVCFSVNVNVDGGNGGLWVVK